MMAPTYIESRLQSQRDRRNHLQFHLHRLQLIQKKPSEIALKRLKSEPKIRTRRQKNTQIEEIQGKNRCLLRKLLEINSRKPSDFCNFNGPMGVGNEEIRRRKNKEIEAENAKIVSRLIGINSDVSKKHLEKEYKMKEKYKEIGSRMRQMQRVNLTLKIAGLQVNSESKNSSRSISRFRTRSTTRLEPIKSRNSPDSESFVRL